MGYPGLSLVLGRKVEKPKPVDVLIDPTEENDGHHFEMLAEVGAEEAGRLIVELESDPENTSFVPYKEEPFFSEIIDYDEVVNLQHLEVEPEFRGQGVATKLMKAGLKEAKKRWSGIPCYINASPMGGVMGLDQLVSFYEQFGFKTLQRYPEFKNALLWKAKL
jgi:GNAT superfamily N-acetyltransferase